uniref:NADH-ubiquinone oxidoreductase chain 2 n=1 Tax=Ampittia dioscorides TaxID=509334 RepID=A0A097KZG9_9NEOP|nr:NADH dehydrogense subunit 2 [Ampittia dioscorides]
MYFTINSNKMFFMFILIFSTLISISSNSWMGCWIGLEINLLSFIPLISNPKNLMTSEASLKYFLTQAIASINFLFSILMKLILLKNFEMNLLLTMMINSSMLMKMGSAPFHFWFPNIVEGLNWMNCFILMTWQKITPMILLSYYMNKNFLMLIMMINTMIGAIGGINQISLRKLMSFSSFNKSSLNNNFHNNLEKILWNIMFSLYTFLMVYMCFLFNFMNTYFFNQLFIINTNCSMEFSLFMNFFSYGGLPSLLGLVPKWISIKGSLINKFFIITFIFVMMSLITLFFYIRIIYSCILFNYMKLKWFKMFLKKMNIFLLFYLMALIFYMGMILSTFIFYN